MWDLSQRCEARKHSHQSEMHLYFHLFYKKVIMVLGHTVFKKKTILFNLQQNVLKLGDFGSCRSVYSKPPHTEYISTRWYRAPECLLTDGYYSLKMDIWSTGCVFFEIMRYRCKDRAKHFSCVSQAFSYGTGLGKLMTCSITVIFDYMHNYSITNLYI